MKIADLTYQRAIDRLSSVGFESLAEKERDIATVWHVEAGMNAGGFDTFYAGAGADLAFYVPEALRHIGAMEKAAIVVQANALFGPLGPPRDRKDRQQALKAMGKEALAALTALNRRYFDDPIDVDDLVEAYAAKP